MVENWAGRSKQVGKLQTSQSHTAAFNPQLIKACSEVTFPPGCLSTHPTVNPKGYYWVLDAVANKGIDR